MEAINDKMKQAKNLLFLLRDYIDKHFEFIPFLAMVLNSIAYINYFFGYLRPYNYLKELGYDEGCLQEHPELIGSNIFYLFHDIGSDLINGSLVFILVLFAKSHNFRQISKISLICLSLLWVGTFLYTINVFGIYGYFYCFLSILYVCWVLFIMVSLTQSLTNR